MLALTTSVEHAKAVYDLSLRYGPTQADLVKRRIAAANTISRIANIEQDSWAWLPYASMTLIPAVIIGLGLAIRKRRQAAL